MMIFALMQGYLKAEQNPPGVKVIEVLQVLFYV